MSRKFITTMAACAGVFLLMNAWTIFTRPLSKVGISRWHITGAPIPVKVENLTYDASGPKVIVLRDRQWVWVANVGLWLFLSYRFSRRVERHGVAWWRGENV
jgi:hypothetical protein